MSKTIKRVAMQKVTNTEKNRDTLVTRFKIAEATIDLAARQIFFREKLVEVQPKVFDLLAYLIVHRDRAISKDELFDQVWPSVVVSESSLTQTVKRARDLFRQHGFTEDIIRTVSRNGYQFDGPVEILNPTTAVSTKPNIRILLAATLVTATFILLAIWHSFFQDDTKTSLKPDVQLNAAIAVLPFSNLAPTPDFQYFVDGLTVTVTDSISQVNGLRVIANSSVLATQVQNHDYAVIGEQLDVSLVVVGSVQKEGDVLRISTRLVRTLDGAQLWSQTFQRNMQKVFSIHDEISLSIYEQLTQLLTDKLHWQKVPNDRSNHAENSQAYLLTLRAQELRRNASKDGLLEADRLLRKALEISPNYPQALVLLADVVRKRSTTGEVTREAGFSEALVLANRAAEIDPQFAEAWLQIADIQYRHFWDFQQADFSFKHALQANPGSAAVHAAYGRYLSRVGQFEQAVVEAQTAFSLDPLSARALSSLTLRLIQANKMNDARNALDKFKQDHPQHYDIPWLEANWHIRMNQHREALQWIALEELDYLRLSLSAIAMHHLGRSDQAQSTLDELIKIDAEGATFQIAEVYAQWQEADRAFEWLERAFSKGDPGLSELYSSLNLSNLYSDPRFANIALRIGLPVK